MSSGSGRSGFVGHAANYAVGNIVGRLVGFVMLPIYTRYLTPADYGVVGLLTFALSALEPFFGARLARAIPRFYVDTSDGREKRAVIWGALILTGIVSLVTTVLLVLVRSSASRLLFGSAQYSVATALFAVNMLSQPIEYTGLMYVRLQGRSRLYLAVSLIKLAMQVVLNVLLVVHWNMNVVGVVLSGIISSAVLGTFLTVYVACHEAPEFDWNVALRMLRYSWPLWFSGIAELYIWSSGAFYLRIFDSLSDVGLLQLGRKFAGVGLLVWTSFFQHWEPMSYRYYTEKDGQRKFQVAFVAVAVLMFVVGLGVSIFSAPTIELMAAPQFRAAAPMVPLLAFCVILSSLASFFNFGFLVTDRTKIHSASQYLTVVVITIAYLAMIPSLGLLGAVVAQGFAIAFNFLVVYRWSKRYFDPGIPLSPLIALIFVMTGACILANALIEVQGIIWSLILKAIIFFAATAMILFIGIRAIRSSDPMVYAQIQSSVRKVSRIVLVR